MNARIVAATPLLCLDCGDELYSEIHNGDVLHYHSINYTPRAAGQCVNVGKWYRVTAPWVTVEEIPSSEGPRDLDAGKE